MKTIRISAKWMRQLFRPCSPEFIASTCHATCCENSNSPIGFVVTIHPFEQARIEALGGVVFNGLLQPRGEPKRRGKCSFKILSNNLCSLHATGEKPFGCIASPFTLNRSGCLVVRHRYINFKCFRAEGSLPVYRAQAGSFKTIFGDVEATRLTAHFDAGGGDTTSEIDNRIYDILMDNDEIKRNRNKP